MNASGPDEQSRLDVLKSFEILDAPAEEVFDRLTQLAARICETPIAAITLVDERRQCFKSAVGLDLRETGRDISFCAHTIPGKQPLAVPDARKDPRFKDNPLVVGKAAIRFYAGVPIISLGGYPLGTLAVMDRVPRTLSDAQMAALQLLAGQVMMHIALRRQRNEMEKAIAEHDQGDAAQQKPQEQLNLLATCVSRLNESLMVTEAEPIDEPGPRIVFVNEAFEQVTGYCRADVLGRSPRMLQGPKTQRTELDRIRAALQKREPVTAELINYKKNGEEFWLENDISPVMDASGRVMNFVAVQRDITERKQKQEELAQTNRALQMLTRCSEALIKTENEQELLEKICRVAVDVGGYRVAWVGYAQDDETRSIKPLAYAGLGEDITDIADVSISWSENLPTGRGPGGRAIRSGMPAVLENVEQDPGFAPWLASARRRGYGGVIALPLRSKDRTFGILALHTTAARPVTDAELKLLQELADNLAFGIHHIRSQERRRRIEAAVLKVATAVSAATTGTEFFEQLLRNMAEALGAQGGFVVRFLPGKPLAIRTISVVVDGKTIENFEYVIEGTPLECLLHNTECIVPDPAGEKFPSPSPLATIGARAYIVRRLDTSADRPAGLLCVLFREPVTEVDFVTSSLQIFAVRAAAELERQDADARIRMQASLLDKAQDAIIVAGIDSRITFWNMGAERLFGWTAQEAVGKTRVELLINDMPDFSEATTVVLEQGAWTGELRKHRKDGTSLTVESHWTLMRDDNGTPERVFSIDSDVTARKAAEREIEHLAFFDPLTGLPNRRLLLDRLQHALAASRRSRHTGALLFIDLDNFKSLNDTLGHDKGDLLLRQVARRLETCVPRKSDTVARLGGDEFVVMLEDLTENPEDAAAQAEIAGEKILAVFNPTFRLDGHEHHTTPSIGVTLFDHRVNNVDELLKRADLAMYQAKAAGRNAIRFFDPDMQTVVSARVALEADLRHGLQQHEFYLHYQRQTDINRHTIGVEALVRWRHPGRGVVAPALFIPLAEETGLILGLGQWVLETACGQLATWAAKPETSHLSVAVNVSPRQFRQPDFVEKVLTVLHQTGARPQHLKLELTENLLVENVENIIAKMSALKTEGVGFSLDDFGTGYSSLSYLKRLPLDQLKIDQSFVRDVLTDPNDAAIARTIVALGQTLGLQVMAEGVETEDQRDFLVRHGCDAYQGYLFSPPLPPEQFYAR